MGTCMELVPQPSRFLVLYVHPAPKTGVLLLIVASRQVVQKTDLPDIARVLGCRALGTF